MPRHAAAAFVAHKTIAHRQVLPAREGRRVSGVQSVLHPLLEVCDRCISDIHGRASVLKRDRLSPDGRTSGFLGDGIARSTGRERSATLDGIPEGVQTARASIANSYKSA